MYSEHDRPSTRTMLITAVAWIAGIAAVIAVAAVVFGVATSRSTPASNAPLVTPKVQSPATMTANVATSQPAPSALVTTDQVAPGPASAASPAAAVAKPKKAVKPSSAVESAVGVVVIDAGHEGSPVPGTDPIGPGSSRRMAKIESGTSGVATHDDESQRNLEVALVLRKALQARGVKVVMVRTSQNVKITNKQRAQMANDAKADLFIRLHCDSGPSSITGILTLRPSKNWYKDHPIVAKSAVAAKLVHRAVVAETGAHDRGITPRDDLVGFNWSQVPSVLVEMGMMSNRAEDRKMATGAYQKKLADGMADGIVAYLKTK